MTSPVCSPSRHRPPRIPVAGPLLAVALLSALPACYDNPVPTPAPPQQRVRTLNIPQNVNSKVDVLFLIDNSNGADPMQTELRLRKASFFKPLEALAAKGIYPDLHIAVVTSDYGAGATGAPGCTPSGLTGGGDQGRFIGIGKKAAASCQRVKSSTNFIEYAYGAGGPVHNLPSNQDLLATLDCMMAVGQSGCGFEHPLESVYAALHNDIADNRGFLRDDARLVIFFVTNEDDASAPPDSDVFDKNKVAQYGYEDSYSRQTRFAVLCGSPAAFPPYNDSRGPLTDCQPAPNPDGISGPGKQYDVARYRDFFSLPRVQGGVKDSPLDVLLFAIDAPEEPFQVILSNPGTPYGQPYVICPALDEGRNPPCVPVLQHSCVNPRNPTFYGDPAVRLNNVVKSAHNNAVFSVCEDDYSPALDAAGKLIAAELGVNAACIKDRFPRDASGKRVTQCIAQDVTLNADGSESRNSLPVCDDPDGPSNTPCWVIEPKPECATTSPDGVGFSVRRGLTNGVPNSAPPHTSTLVECATIAP